MALLENMQIETVSRLSLREPATIEESATVRDAVDAMREKHLGCAIVVDAERKPIGIFTEAMVTRLVPHDPAVVDEPIRRQMSEQVPWIKLADPIAELLAALEYKNSRFMCVVDDDGRLIGLTGQKGLMEYIAEHFPDQVCVQRIGGDPFPHEREGA